MYKYNKGEQIRFEASEDCKLKSLRFRPTDAIEFELSQDIDLKEGFGKGGPWGFGGYTSEFLESIMVSRTLRRV